MKICDMIRPATFRCGVAFVLALCMSRLAMAGNYTLSQRNTSFTHEVSAGANVSYVSNNYTVDVPSGMAARVSIVRVAGGSGLHCRSSLKTVASTGETNLIGNTIEFGSQATISVYLTVTPDTWTEKYPAAYTYVAGTVYIPIGTRFHEYTDYYSIDRYTISVQYIKLLPDLRVNLQISPDNAVAVDETATLCMNVLNTGRRTTGRQTIARLFLNSWQMGSDILVDALGSGKQIPFSGSIPSLSSGLYTISAAVDVGMEVEESNESNNTASIEYRVYDRVPYKVAYDANLGSGTMRADDFVAGTEKSLSRCSFTRKDYCFAGWSTSANGDVEYADGEKVKHLSFTRNATVTLYAIWRPQECVIVFNALGGTASGSTNRVYSAVEPCASLPYASKSGYDFLGWYTDETGGVRITTNTVFKSGCTLYARYEAAAGAITFDPNGGIGEMPDALFFKSSYAVLPECGFTKSGWHFIGWESYKPNAQSGKASYKPGDLFKDNANSRVTMYAVWKEDTRTTYRFDANGGMGYMSDIVVTNEEDFVSPPCAFKNGDLKFIKWNKSRSGDIWTYIAVWGRELDLGDCYHGDGCFVTEINHPWFVISGSTSKMLRSVLTDYGESSMYFLASGPGRYTGRFRLRSNHGRNDYGLTGQKLEIQTSYGNTTQGGMGTTDWKDLHLKVDNDSDIATFVFKHSGLERSGAYDSEAQTSSSFALVDPGFFMQTNYVVAAAQGTTNILASSGTEWSAKSSASWLSVERTASDPHKIKLSFGANSSIYERFATVEVSSGEVVAVTQLPKIPSTMISFDTQGGTLGADNVGRYAILPRLGELPVPIREHWHFDGWVSSMSSGTLLSDISDFGEKASAYALWSPETVEVRLDGNGGLLIDKTSVALAIGSGFASLPVPVRHGHKFLGWTSERDGGALIDESTAVGGEITLYALWSDVYASSEYTLIANPNNGILDGANFGSSNGKAAVGKVTVKYGSTAYNSLGKAKRVGYKFNGWYTAKTGGVKVFDANGRCATCDYWTSEKTWKGSDDLIVYAQWTAKTYTFKFNPNGGTFKGSTSAYSVPNSSSTTKPTYGKTYYWRIGVATRTGYTFKGWYDAATGGKQVYDAKGEALRGDYWSATGSAATWKYDGGDVSLYAQWTPKTYTLTLDPNGGTYKDKTTAHTIPNSSQTTKPTYGKSYYWRVGAATRTGYIFKGWYDAATGGKQVYDANGEAVDGDYWKGSGKTATWAYDDNVTLYAQWAKAYTVRFYPNGSGSTLSGSIFGASDGQSKTATVTFGLKSDINNVVGVAKRSGYVFLGWYTQRDAGGLVFDANGNCRKGGAFWNSKGCWIKESNVSLYAHWAKAYTVRFYPNGSGSTLSGSIFGASDGQSKTATVTFGLKSDINNVVGVAKRPGYVFAGWYTQRDAGGLVFDANGKCRKGGAFWNSSGCWIKESNVSLYAHWTKVSASAPPVIGSSALAVTAPNVVASETVDGVAYLSDGESFPVEVRVDADGFAVVELEDAIFCGYIADGSGELVCADGMRLLILLAEP